MPIEKYRTDRESEADAEARRAKFNAAREVGTDVYLRVLEIAHRIGVPSVSPIELMMNKLVKGIKRLESGAVINLWDLIPEWDKSFAGNRKFGHVIYKGLINGDFSGYKVEFYQGSRILLMLRAGREPRIVLGEPERDREKLSVYYPGCISTCGDFRFHFERGMVIE